MSTGLPCGTQIANLFLSCLDESVTSSFRSDIDLYKRYIDDVLIVGRFSCLTTLLVAFNWFDSRIRITHDAGESRDGNYTSFLDISINLRNDTIEYATSRKPMCMYAYLSSSSCHSRATKLGIVHTEIIRLMRTNMFEADFNREKSFFLCKLNDRGYDFKSVREIANRYLWSCKHSILLKRERKLDKRIIPLRMIYSGHASNLIISEVLKQHQHLPPREFADAHRVVTCYVSGRSLLRLRYARFL